MVGLDLDLSYTSLADVVQERCSEFRFRFVTSLLQVKARVELKCVVCLVSSFKVDTNGPFEYIMDSYLEPTKMAFPLSCHAELSRDDADETGVNTPVKIIWSYDESQAILLNY